MHTSETRTVHDPRIALLSHLAVTIVAAMTLLLGCGQSADSDTGTLQLPPEVIDSGFAIQLTSFEAAVDRIAVTFNIRDLDLDHEPSILNIDFPLRNDVVLQGFEWLGGNSGSARHIFPAGSEPGTVQPESYEVVLFVSPVRSAGEQVGITFTALRFGPDVLVAGDWAFVVRTSADGRDPQTLAIDAEMSSENVVAVVRNVFLFSDRSVVEFQIRVINGEKCEHTGLVATTGTAATVEPRSIVPIADGYLATFNPFPRDTEIRLALAPVLVEALAPINVHLPISGGKLVGGAPVNVRISGERMSVTELNMTSDTIRIRVENVEPQGVGRVMLRFPGDLGAALRDEDGRDYALVGANTNMEKTSKLEKWAGGSTFVFEGTITDEVSELYLSVDSFAMVVAGEWQVSFVTPD